MNMIKLEQVKELNLIKRVGSLPNVVIYSGDLGHTTQAVNALENNSGSMLTRRRNDVSDVHPSRQQLNMKSFDFANEVKANMYSDVVAGGCDPQTSDVRMVHSQNKKGYCDSDGYDSDTEAGRQKGRPLKSGRLTKPDEAGIKKVVRYPHEKLNRVHVKSRIFTDLTFHNLVAGELELILDDHTRPDEKVAHLHILEMLAYHKEYVDSEDLKDHYDATMKEIERGTAVWTEYPRLVSVLHTNLTFRATVRARERDAVALEKMEKLTEKKAKASQELKSKDSGDKVVYCSDFNKGACPFNEHHEGMFNRKSVTKWHICCKCYLQEGNPKKFHAALDCKNF